MAIPKNGSQHTKRDLKAFKRQQEHEAEQYRKVHEDRNSSFNRYVDWIEEHQPGWVKVNGETVLRVKDSRYVAAPKTGRKDARNFAAIDLEKGEIVAHLEKKEVVGWLIRTYAKEIDG